MYIRFRDLIAATMMVVVFLSLGYLTVNAQQETKYTFLMAGTPAGHQSTVLKPDGTREIAFEFNDRGRGPKLLSQIKVDKNGLITSLSTDGNDYLKAAVSERFSTAGGVATWKNQAE